MIFAFLYLALFYIILWIYFRLLKNSVFGISIKRKSFTGFFILFDYLIFIFPATLIMLFVNPNDLWVAFKINIDIVPLVGFIINIQYLFMMVILYTFTRFLSCLKLPVKLKNVALDNVVAKSFLFWFSVYGVIVVIFAIVLFDAKHALIYNFLYGENLYNIRSDTEAHFFLRYVKFACIALMPAISFLLGFVKDINFKSRFLYILMLFFISTFGGDKSVMIYPLIIYTIGYLSRPDFHLRIKSFLLLSFVCLLGALFLYFVVINQYPGLSQLGVFIDYLYQRIFIAQLIGVYEQYSIELYDFEYIYKALPVPSSIFDFKSYHKDLMIISEDISNPETVGIKNTLFVAEAHAIGGFIFAFFSSILFSISYSLSLIILYYIFRFFLINNRMALILAAITYFYFQRTTGGFTEVLLFKNLILVVGAFLPCLIFMYLAKSKCFFNANKVL